MIYLGNMWPQQYRGAAFMNIAPRVMLPLADLAGGRALVATHFDDKPLTHEHGGPARLLVPHLYFWKSAKWVSALQFTPADEAGFWELRGYHMRGDPFQEERYG